MTSESPSVRIHFGLDRDPPPDLQNPRVRARYETYWRDRERLDALAPGVVFVRPLVPGEFAKDLDVGQATEVEVWRGGRARGSGSVRNRRPLGVVWSVSDAEDSVNGFFRLGPPRHQGG